MHRSMCWGVVCGVLVGCTVSVVIVGMWGACGGVWGAGCGVFVGMCGV